MYFWTPRASGKNMLANNDEKYTNEGKGRV